MKGRRRFFIFLHKYWRLRIKEQEGSLVVENQELKGKKNKTLTPFLEFELMKTTTFGSKVFVLVVVELGVVLD